ncbi:Uncharacterised protein [Mycobacteroides abscessus subsp. abscessus]|nr:Uncharacterised protein [Mycobacteroides abscessus subsp. abscessus]
MTANQGSDVHPVLGRIVDQYRRQLEDRMVQ